MSIGMTRVFALGVGLGLGAALGVNVILAGGIATDEHQIQWRVEATATAVSQQARARAMATAVAKATETAVQNSQNAARCAESRGAQIDARLVGKPGISYTTFAAAGTVRNLCGHPLEVDLHVLVLAVNGMTINAIDDEQPIRLAPGESRAFTYSLGRFPIDYVAELHVVPAIQRVGGEHRAGSLQSPPPQR